MTHGQADEADQIVSDIEQKVEDSTDEPLPEPEGTSRSRQRDSIGFGPVVKAVVWRDTSDARCWGFMLMVTQAFFYNAIFFTYALVLANFYGCQSVFDRLLHPALRGRKLPRPLLLGRLFDVVGRKIMISSTYIIAGTGLIIVGYLFQQNSISATQLTVGWTAIFFSRRPEPAPPTSR